MEQFAIGANLESAAARGNQRERFDPLAELKNFGRQTDSLRRVVSNDAVFDRDLGFHRQTPFRKRSYRRDRVRSRYSRTYEDRVFLRLHTARKKENLSANSRKRWRFGACSGSSGRKSKEQDKRAGDHQREHPNQIDVEPRAAQNADPKFFVDQNRDQRCH
jgi:hypothetical protein